MFDWLTANRVECDIGVTVMSTTFGSLNAMDEASISGAGDPPACGSPTRWLAYYTVSRHEKAVAKYLDYQAVEQFLPLILRHRRWKNGCQVKVEEPFFPSYIFARVDPRQYFQVLNIPGVVSVVGAGRKPTPLDDEEIESLRTGLATRNSEPHPFLVVGRKARITAGAFAGKTGVVIEKSTNLRVVLTVEAIMKSFSVEVDGEELEMVS